MKNIFFGLLSMAFCLNAAAQVTPTDTTKVNTLEPVMLKGRIITQPLMIKQKVDLTKKVVQPKNVTDLFRDLNGFHLIKRGSYSIDPSFRAAQYEQLNIQFNGGTKTMNSCPSRMDPITSHVNPDDIKEVEVIKGPFSVRYGATFGGIINFVSEPANYNNEGFHGSVSSGYETNANAFVGSISLSQVTEKFKLSGGIAYRDFGNYEDGDGNEIPSSFRTIDYDLGIGYKLSNNQEISAKWQQSFGRDILHAGLMMDTEEDNSSTLSLDYNYKYVSPFVRKITAKVYYSYVDHVMSNLDRPMAMSTEAVSPVESHTAGGKVEFTLKPASQLTLYTGVDALLISREGNRNRKVKRNMQGEILPEPKYFTDAIWQDSYINDFGYFIEGRYKFSNKTSLTAGVRYDLVLAESQAPAEDFKELYPNLDQTEDHNFSGNISLQQDLGEKHNLELAIGRGVRSASMIERYINHFSVGMDGHEYVGNPYLDAEVNNQIELGLKGRQNFEGIFNELSYGLSAYYSKYENYIAAVIDPSLDKKFMPMMPPQEVKRFINIDDAYKTGLEANIRVGFYKDFFAGAEIAYVYTKNKDLDEAIALTPPLTTQLSLGMEKEKYWAQVDYNITSEQDDIAQSFGEESTPGYSLLDIRGGFKPWNNLDIGLAVLNVFDKTYHNHLNYSYINQAGFENVPINDPGRNFSIFITYDF